MNNYRKPPSVANNRCLETASELCSKEGVVILQPIAMRIPNSYGIYSPSKLRPKKEITYKEFLSRFADYPRKIRICFDETPYSATIFQRSELITAYGYGLDCWYIIETYIKVKNSLLDFNNVSVNNNIE